MGVMRMLSLTGFHAVVGVKGGGPNRRSAAEFSCQHSVPGSGARYSALGTRYSVHGTETVLVITLLVIR